MFDGISMMQKMRSQSIASRLLLLIILSAIPAFFYMVLSAERLREARIEAARNDAQRITNVLANYQLSLLQSTGDLLAALSNAPAILGAQWDLCNQFMRGVLAVNPRHANLGVADLNGRIVCSGIPTAEEVNVSDREYFERARAANHYVIGDFHIGRISGERSLGIAYPIRSEAGNVKYVLFAALKVEALAPPLDEVPFHDHSIVKVFDSQGTLLAAIPRDDNSVGRPVVPAKLHAASRKASKGLLTATTPDGEEWLYAFAGIGTFADEHHITMALAAPIRQLLLESERRFWHELVGAVLTLGGVMAVGWLLANAFILRQLQTLVATTKSIAQGDFNARASLSLSHGELAELSENFDIMAAHVQQHVEKLQRFGTAMEERNQVMAMIVAGVPLEEILLRLVQLIEMQIPNVTCSVLRVDEHGCIHHLVAPHLPQSFIEAVNGQQIGPNRGSCGTAAFLGQAVITQDIANDPRWHEFRDIASAHELHACWSHPIIARNGEVLGTFAMYFNEPKAPSAEDLALLDVAHNLAAIAIDAHDLRESLEKAATQYRYLFENNPNPMWVYDEETLQFLAVNDAAVTFYGFSRAEFLRMTLRALLPVQDIGRFEVEILPSLKKSGTIVLTQLRHRRKKGDIVTVDVTAFNILFAGRAARFTLIRDVTDVQRVHSSLEERNRLIEVLLESTGEGIYGIDSLGRISLANRACAELLGYESPDALIGLPVHQTLHHSSTDAPCDGSNCSLYNAMSTREHFHSDEHFFWHCKGYPLPVEFWHYPMWRDGASDGAIVTFLDITSRHAQREVLAWQATHDALTGLPNRTMLQSALQRVIVETNAEASQFALLLIDLDQFKEVNDTLGHAAGDQLLRVLGPRLMECVSVDETVVRLGGDEFAVVLRPGMQRQAVAALADRMIQVIEAPVEVEGTRVQVGASIGAAFYPDDGTSAEELLRCADVAMYEAKQHHLRYAAYATAFYDDKRPERLSLMSDLRTAIAANQLCLYYQPKIDAASNSVMGFEALVRWQHPVRGLIPPAEFVPWIERSDLIHPFTAWVLETAIAQCHAWTREGFPLCISVNISTGNLIDTALPERIDALLRRHDVQSSQIELEITESSIMANPVRSLDVVAALRHLGLRVSIDDFGTGYSSLAYLQRLPVNCVKVDRSFVRSLLVDDGARLIASAIIDLSHKLKLEVVAEGVEDRETLETLRAFGCDQVQGYYIARPLPASQAMQWLQERHCQPDA